MSRRRRVVRRLTKKESVQLSGASWVRPLRLRYKWPDVQPNLPLLRAGAPEFCAKENHRGKLNPAAISLLWTGYYDA